MKVTKADIFFHKYNSIHYISNSYEGIKFLKEEDTKKIIYILCQTFFKY